MTRCWRAEVREVNAVVKRQRRTAWTWAPSIVWAAVVLVSTLSPEPLASKIGVEQTSSNLLGHFLLFGILTGLVLRAAGTQSGTQAFTRIILFLVLFAGADEAAQSQIPGRDSSLGDLITDVVAIVALMAVSLWYSSRLGSPDQRISGWDGDSAGRGL